MIRFLFKQFMVPFTKPTAFVHNMPALHRLKEGVQMWVGECIVLRGTIMYQGKQVFKTHLAQAYPPLLCIKFGELVEQSVLIRKIALENDLEIPHADTSMNDGLPATLANGSFVEAFGGGPVHSTLDPLVPEGHGMVKGPNHLEHVALSLTKQHPSASPAKIDPTLEEAVDFEIEHEIEDIDAFRSRVLFDILHRSVSMKQEQQQWASQAVPPLRNLVSRIHGPLMLLVLIVSGFPNPHGLVKDCVDGFPFVGMLPPCEGASVPWNFESSLTVAELRSYRQTINALVNSKLKDLPFSEDIFPTVLEDVEEGSMSEPAPL